MTTQAPTETGEPKAGIYDGEILGGEEQYGESSKGTLELILLVSVPALGRSLSTLLYFSEGAAPYSIETLRYVGWKGSSLADLSSIYHAKVKLEIRYEVYDGKSRMKTQLSVPGTGRISTSKAIDKSEFAAKVAALLGNNGAASAAMPQGTVKPPF
jgi:hypothetical protein